MESNVFAGYDLKKVSKEIKVSLKISYRKTTIIETKPSEVKADSSQFLVEWKEQNEGYIRIGSEEKFRLSLYSHKMDAVVAEPKEIAAHYYRVSKVKKQKLSKGWIPLLQGNMVDKKKKPTATNPSASVRVTLTIHQPKQVGYLLELNLKYELWRAYSAFTDNLLDVKPDDSSLDFKDAKPLKVPFEISGSFEI